MTRALGAIRAERDGATQRASSLESELRELGLELGAAKTDQKHYKNEYDGARAELDTLRARLKQASRIGRPVPRIPIKERAGRLGRSACFWPIVSRKSVTRSFNVLINRLRERSAGQLEGSNSFMM